MAAMIVSDGLDGLGALPGGAAVSIGNFDGLHRGHRHILDRMAEACAADGGGACPRAVVTFEPHPLTVLRPNLAPPRLTPLAEKRRLLAEAGVDHAVELAPTADVLGLSAEAFWGVLVERARPRFVVEGESFAFGRGRAGTVEAMRRWAAGTGVEVVAVGPVEAVLADYQVAAVSSSLARWLVAHGRMRDAAACLGRPYALVGTVVPGFQRGRTIGMPTANLDCGEQLVPADGVYAGRCRVEAGDGADGVEYPAAVSIGSNPTFGDPRRQVEAHLIGYAGDLYGRTLRVELLDWVRGQEKFDGVEALKAQMARDLQRVRRVASDPLALPAGA